MKLQQRNAQGLKKCRTKLILFPNNKKILKPAESTGEEGKVATQLKTEVLPTRQASIKVKVIIPTGALKIFYAYLTLRKVVLYTVDGKRTQSAAENPAH